jgi:hypothetical protein
MQLMDSTCFSRSRPTLKPSTAIVSKAQEFVDIYRYPPKRWVKPEWLGFSAQFKNKPEVERINII